jgi:hypothetical protein
MDFYHDFGGWTLLLSILISAVVSDAFGLWMERLSTY